MEYFKIYLVFGEFQYWGKWDKRLHTCKWSSVLCYSSLVLFQISASSASMVTLSTSFITLGNLMFNPEPPPTYTQGIVRVPNNALITSISFTGDLCLCLILEANQKSSIGTSKRRIGLQGYCPNTGSVCLTMKECVKNKEY